ncbi:MAG: DUF4258 domain-containing protein [Candidatus Blackburnbacteria bacterium]|nr:DUF4258 domain-containing protein [Candidatus Blackburnbacteria bacterium]
MRIVFTKHAIWKFADLEKMGWRLGREDVRSAILFPDSGPVDSGYGALAVLKKLDERHNLRVIYVTRDDIITVITFYPTESGRYEQK